MEKDRVFFWGLLCFIIGIAGGSFFRISIFFLALLGSAFFITLLLVFRERKFLLFGLFAGLFILGSHLSASEKQRYENIRYSLEEETGTFRILSDPVENGFFQNIFLRTLSCGSENCPSKDILWQAPLSLGLQPGDSVSLSCRFDPPKNFDPAFDYRMFLAKNGVGFFCEHAARIIVLPEDKVGKALASLYLPKRKLEDALSHIIPEPEAGLAKGLLLGGNNYLSASLQEKFTRIGLSHMVAVSGYNITLIAQCLLVIGLFFGLWRKHALLAALFGVMLFILMIGVPASALRAGIMAGVVFAALQAGRLARQTNALLLAASLMLFIHPLLLRYDLGFQLSFLATLSIILSVPFLDRFLQDDFIGKSLVEIIFMTCAVELFVLPIILFSFHTFSPLVFIGNFLVLLVPFIMTLSFFSALLFILLPGSHVFFSWMSYGLLTIITRSVEWLGDLPKTSVAVESFGLTASILWYIVVAALIFSLKEHYSYKRHEERT